MEPGDRRRRARRRAVRVVRFLQSSPLWYLGAIPVGGVISLAGYASGRPDWFRLGAWITAPGVLLLIWVASMLALAAVFNLGIFAWNAVARGRGAIRSRIARTRSADRR